MLTVCKKEHQGAEFKIPTEMEFVYVLKHNFQVSNNESEYEALLVSLCML